MYFLVGLVKKLEEIKTLCDVDACAIINNPNDPNQLEVFPNPAEDAHKVLSRFMEAPESFQSRKMFDQESFVKEQISKAKEKHQRQRNFITKEETELKLIEYLEAGQVVGDVGMVDFSAIACLIDQKKNEIVRQLNKISVEEGLGNGAEIAGGGGQAIDHTQLLEANANTMQNESWNMVFNNHGPLPFGDADYVPNLTMPNPHVP